MYNPFPVAKPFWKLIDSVGLGNIFVGMGSLAALIFYGVNKPSRDNSSKLPQFKMMLPAALPASLKNNAPVSKPTPQKDIPSGIGPHTFIAPTRNVVRGLEI